VIPGKTYTIDTLGQIAWRRKWLIVLPAILVAAISVVVIKRLPNLYRSETLILVVPQRVPESYVKSTVTARIEDRLQSISQQILSRTRLEQVITDFNLYATERANRELMEDIIERMRTRDIGINIIKGDSFRVSYTASDPRTAQRVTERLGSLFIDESLRDREVLAEGTNEFLSTQLDEAQRKLVANENKLLEYQRLHDGELPSQTSANMQGLHDAEMALQSVGESLNRDRERRISLERSVADILDAPDEKAAVTPDGKPRPVSVDLDQELATAKQALLALELKLRPEHPDVKKQRRVVEELEKRLDAENGAVKLAETLSSKPTAPSATMDYNKRKKLTDARTDLDNVDRQIQGKMAEETRLQGQIAMYNARIQAAPLREAELTSLTRDYETLQQTYRTLLQKKEESQISANLEKRQIGEQFKIVDPARMPERPASPDRPRLYLMSMLAAIALGFAAAVAAEFFDRSLRSEADVRAALNLMVVATIPYVRDGVASARRLRRNVAIGVGATTVLAVCATVAWRLLR
jgi:polysaccharide chain length determinant protein (PEP-CTERM system associated)